jgi:uncharacterized protein
MKITIGQHDGKPIAFDLETLVATRLLIQANSGAGKSYLIRKLMEELFGHIPVIAIDPEGEFATLREKFGYVLVGKGGETPADVRTAGAVAEKLLEIRASAVCDLYEMKPADRHRWVQAFLESVVNAPKAMWRSTIFILDEVHVFCPEKGAGESCASEAVIDLITRGRKRGFCTIAATQRLSKFRKDASAELLNRLVGGTFEDVDIKRAVDLMGVAREDERAFKQSLKTLDPGMFYAFGRAISKERVLFKVDPVATSHPKAGSAKHAAEPPPTPDQVKAMLPQLADLPKAAEEKARTVEELRGQVRKLAGELAAAKRAPQLFTSLAERDRQWKTSLQEFYSQVGKLLDDRNAVTRQAIRLLEGGATNLTSAFKALKVVVPPTGLPANSGKGKSEHGSFVAKEESGEAARPVAASNIDVQWPTSEEIAASASSNGNLSRPQLNILAALAQFEALGRTAVDKKWIAHLAGASHRSSAYINNLGYLRSNGYIDYPSPGAAALTKHGRDKAPYVDAPATAAEMLARCQKMVNEPQARILKALAAAYPKSLIKPDLAERAGASWTSSAFINNLGALRSAGMLDYPEQGRVRLAEWIFLE